MAITHSLLDSLSGTVTVTWGPRHCNWRQDTRSLFSCQHSREYRVVALATHGRHSVSQSPRMPQEVVCLSNRRNGGKPRLVARCPGRSGGRSSAECHEWGNSRRQSLACGVSVRGKIDTHASSRGNLTNELSLESDVGPASGGGSSNGVVETDQRGSLHISGEVGTLVSGYGWRAREVDINKIEELRVVANIQATAFHTPAAAFDELFFEFFKAEVLSALIYRARVSPRERYACIIAESITDPSLGEPPVIVGAVDVTAYGDRRVLDHLPDVEEYLYVSGLAVDSQYRRQGVATLLLKACDMRAREWNKLEYLVLHAYEDDMAARNLYTRAGYEVIASDPLWLSSWVGRRRRVLMAKKCPGISTPF